MSIGAKTWEGGGAASVPDASETVKGIIEIATSLEAATGLDDLKAMTPLTVKERIDAALVGGVEYKGEYTGQSLVTAQQGDMYISSGSQTLGGVSLSNGDHIIFNEDAADPVTSSMFDVIDNTETPASETVAGVIEIATDAEATAGSATSKALVPSNISSIDLKQLRDVNYTAGASINDYVLTYDDSTGLWGAEAAAGGGNQITDVASQTGSSFTATANEIYICGYSTGTQTITFPDASSSTDGDLIGLSSVAATEFTVDLVSSDGTTNDLLNMNNQAKGGTNGAITLTLKQELIFFACDGLRWRQLSRELADVAKTGAYSDLSGTPTLVTDLDGLSDVTITSAAEGNLLQNNASGQFVNVAKSTIDVGDFNDDATYQLRDAGLTSISGLTTAADKMIYTTASDTYAVTDLTSAGRALLDDADATAQRTTLGLGTAATSASTDFQPIDAGLTSISGLTTSADKMIYTTASDTYATSSITAAGRALLDDADATAQRSTLGLGTAATSDTGDFLASTAALNNLSDVSYTAGAGIDNYVLTYDHSTTSWGAEAAASGGLSAVVDDTSPQLGGALDVNGQAITSASNGDVTINPDGTGDISVGADIIPDADDTHTLGSEDNRFVTLHSELNGAVQFKARNETGGALTKGQAVYISGVSGDVPLVSLARANSASTMPAHGLLAADVSNNADVQVISFGNLTDYNTTTHSLSLGDTVYVSAATAGALTSSAPAGETNLIQNIGKVVRASSTVGIVKVGGAGRSAATPNLNDGKIFLGNASNQAVSTALSSVAVTSFNTQTGALTIGGDDLTADHTASNYTPANANIDGHLSGIDDELLLKAPLASPSLTGTPTGPTATQGDNSTQLATTAYVDTAVSGAGGGGVDPTLTVVTNTTYTLSAANAPGIHIWYGASNSSTFTVTMPDISNVLSSAVSVNGDPGSTFEVYIGRGQAGNITVSAADGIDLLGDGSVTYSTTQTVDSGQWVKLVGWYISGSTQRYLMDSAAQPRDAGLTSISGLTTAADKMIYTTASDTYAVADLTAAGRAILDDADATAQRSTLGLVIGTDVLANVVEDTTPQLGGALDVNGQDIVTTSNADLDLAPDGTGAVVLKGNATGGSGKIKFNCENNSHAVTIQGPAHSAAATYTLTLPTSDGNADQVLKTDGSGVLDWVDQTSAGESEQIKQVSSNYTVTTADIEDGVRILYTGTASVWYVTLPDPSSLLSSASTVGGAAVDAVSVEVGRDRTGDTNFTTTQGVGLLNDGSAGGASGNRTTRGGEWIRALGFYNGTTSNPDWLVEDTSNAYPWAYVAQTTTDYLAPGTYHACSGTITMNARMSRFDNAQLVLIRNVGTGTITIDGYSTDTVDGQASITLSAGEYVELMANTSSSDFEIINQSYDSDDIVASRTGVNYTASNTDNITTHLAGIDTALGNVGGGGSSYTYSAITAGTTSAQAWYHYSVDTSGGAVTINLPALSGLTDGDEIRVKLRDATNSVTIDANSTETIDGSQTFTLDVVYSSITLVVGSAEWEIV